MPLFDSVAYLRWCHSTPISRLRSFNVISLIYLISIWYPMDYCDIDCNFIAAIDSCFGLYYHGAIEIIRLYYMWICLILYLSLYMTSFLFMHFLLSVLVCVSACPHVWLCVHQCFCVSVCLVCLWWQRWPKSEHVATCSGDMSSHAWRRITILCSL